MKGYLDAKELESYKKEDLQELAKQLGVDAEGTKKEIAARCAAVEVDIPDDNELIVCCRARFQPLNCFQRRFGAVPAMIRIRFLHMF